MTQDEIRTKLEDIKDFPTQTALKVYVTEYILDQMDEREKIEGWFKDLKNHGCISGMVSGLIYYTDTHVFFDKYYEDIMTLRDEVSDVLNEEVNSPKHDDLKNWFTWWAFQLTAGQIAGQIGLEL